MNTRDELAAKIMLSLINNPEYMKPNFGDLDAQSLQETHRLTKVLNMSFIMADEFLKLTHKECKHPNKVFSHYKTRTEDFPDKAIYRCSTCGEYMW